MVTKFPFSVSTVYVNRKFKTSETIKSLFVLRNRKKKPVTSTFCSIIILGGSGDNLVIEMSLIPLHVSQTENTSFALLLKASMSLLKIFSSVNIIMAIQIRAH